MEEKNEIKQDILIDEATAKREFLEELKSKNLEETQQIERAKILAALKEQEECPEAKKEVDEEIKKEMLNINKEKKKLPPFFKTLKLSFIDTLISAVVSVAALYLFDLILKLLFGYYIVDKKGMYIIMLFIVLLAYPVVMENTKFGKVLSKKIGKKQVTEGEV